MTLISVSMARKRQEPELCLSLKKAVLSSDLVREAQNFFFRKSIFCEIKSGPELRFIKSLHISDLLQSFHYAHPL